MNEWKKPTFTELCMNAEIGAYQEDGSEDRETIPVLAPEPTPLETHESARQHVA
jgi:hypothetical protein